jgi:hypothetical protein
LLLFYAGLPQGTKFQPTEFRVVHDGQAVQIIRSGCMLPIKSYEFYTVAWAMDGVSDLRGVAKEMVKDVSYKLDDYKNIPATTGCT